MTEPEALVLSAVTEAILAFLVAMRMAWPCRGPRHVAAASAVATAVTHPQLWALALWAYPRWGVWESGAVLEVAVILVEAGLIAWMAGLRLDRAALVSLLANGGSCLLGVVVQSFLL